MLPEPLTDLRRRLDEPNGLSGRQRIEELEDGQIEADRGGGEHHADIRARELAGTPLQEGREVVVCDLHPLRLAGGSRGVDEVRDLCGRRQRRRGDRPGAEAGPESTHEWRVDDDLAIAVVEDELDPALGVRRVERHERSAGLEDADEARDEPVVTPVEDRDVVPWAHAHLPDEEPGELVGPSIQSA